MRVYQRGIIVFIVLILLWALIVRVGHVPTYLVVSPSQVALSLWHNGPLLLSEAKVTILESIVGLCLAVFWGAMLALFMSLFKVIRWWALPILIVSQAIPTFAIAPLFVVWFGYGMSSKVAVTLFTLFFPITIALFDGLRRTPEGYLDLAKVMGKSRFRRLWFIKLPAALPAFASGIRMATAWAPMAAVVGEWVGASHGLGFLMLLANARLNIALLFAALSVLVVYSLTSYFLVDRGLKRWLFWEGK